MEAGPLRDLLLETTGVDIVDANNSFRSTYEILLDISKVWKDLDDMSRANILEKLAGKHRASVLANILNDSKTLENVYNTVLNSEGSAMEEFQKRTESIQYALNQLSAAWQEFSLEAISTEQIVFVIDKLKELLDVVSDIGPVKMFATAIGGLFGAFIQSKGIPYLDNLGKQLEGEKIKLFGKEFEIVGDQVSLSSKTASDSINSMTDVVESVGDASESSLTKTTRAATTSEKAIRRLAGAGSALKTLTAALGKVAIAMGGMYVFSKIVETAYNAYNDKKYAVENLSSEISDTESNIRDLNAQLQELESNEISTVGDKEKISMLREQIRLQDKVLEQQKQQKVDTIVNDATGYFAGKNDIIDSSFVDEMQAAEDAVNQYASSLEFLEKNAEAVENADETLKIYASNMALYENEYLALNETVSTYTKTQEELNSQYTSAVSAIEATIARRADLVYALENGTEAQKEAAKQALIDMDVKLHEQKVILGLADTLENATQKYDDYSKKHEVLKSVAESANKTHVVTVEQMKQLEEKFPDVAEAIVEYSEVTSEGYALEEEALAELNGSYIESQKIQLQAEYDKTEAAVAEAKARIQAYMLEIGSLAELQKAYQAARDTAPEGEYIDGMGYTPYLSKDYIQYQKDLREIEESEIHMQTLLSKINGLGGGTKVDPLEEDGDPGSGGSSSSGSSSKSADIWDEYAHALAKANDEIERYNKVVEITQGKLDLNQSTENRTVELLAEEVQLYDELIASTKAKYKVVNDTLWAQQQGLQKMYTEAAKYMGLDADAVANMTDADLEAYIELKLDEDKANDQKIAHLLNGIIDMRENVHGLHLDWLDMKAEIKELEREEINIRINFQNDVTEKFEESREGAEKVLDILEEIEGTEQRRSDLLDALNDSYETEFAQNLKMYEETIKDLQGMEKGSDAYNDTLEEAYRLEQRNLDVIKEQLDNKLRQIEAQRELAYRLNEEAVYGEQGQDAWEKSRENEIDRLQNQLDALDEDTSEADYLEELEEKEETIRKLEEKLANLQRERTVKQLKQEEDGSWQWEYVVDDRAIAETQSELDDARKDLQKTKDDKALEDQKDAIQNRIDAIEDEIESRAERLDLMNQQDAEFYDEQERMAQEHAEKQVEIMNDRTTKTVQALNNLETKTRSGLKEVDNATAQGLSDLSDTYSERLGSMSSMISSWVGEIIDEFNRLQAAQRAAQEEAEGMVGASYVASVASGGTVAAGGIKFVEANNFHARLHYGERVLTRQEAAQYNELEEDIKSGKLEAYFNSLREDTAMSFSDAATAGVMRTTSMPTTNSNTTSFVIEHLELPEVKDPTDFARVIDNWARGEFSGMAQRARIVKAK